MRLADAALLHDLKRRVEALEKKPVETNKLVEINKLCPKCGLVPIRGRHVMFCKGRK